MRPKISVIITTRNRPESLQNALQSVIDDEYSPKEIIIVDDHSDRPVDLAIDYPSLRIIRTEKRCGVASCRNQGLLASSGEFVAFLDDDDVSYPNKLKTLMDAAEKTGADFVFGRTVKSFEGNEQKKVLIPEQGFTTNGKYSPIPVADFIIRMPCHNNAVLIRSEPLKNAGGYDEDAYYFDDWAGWLRLFSKGISPVFVPIDVAEFRYHYHGFSHQVNTTDRLSTVLRRFYEHIFPLFSKEHESVNLIQGLLKEIEDIDFKDYDHFVHHMLSKNFSVTRSHSFWLKPHLKPLNIDVHPSLQVDANTIREEMIDPPENTPRFDMAINKVGIVEQPLYLSVQTDSGLERLYGSIDVMVNLPAQYRGIHMSRIVGEIDKLSCREWEHPLFFLEELKSTVLHRQRGTQCYLDLSLQVALDVGLSVSGKEYHQILTCKCGINDNLYYLGYIVPHMTACPCVQCYSDCINQQDTDVSVPTKITHSQRAETEIIVWSRDLVAAKDFRTIEIARDSLVIVVDMLRREDEFNIVYNAHTKAQFIEDCVRDLGYRIKSEEEFTSLEKVTIKSRSFESIHSRDIAATLELIP